MWQQIFCIASLEAMQLSRDLCNSSRDVTQLSHDATADILHCFAWNNAVISRCNSVIAQCDCSYPALLGVKQCSYRAMYRAMCAIHRMMYHSYRAMRVIYCAMWPTSCTMWSSPILKQMAHHRYHVLCFLGTLRATITRDTGVLTAGQSYNLTCTVILDGITGSPAIEWFDSNSSPLLNSTDVTVESIVMVNDSAYNRTLTFSSLHTSHEGQYTCRAVLGRASAMASTELSVQSACVKLMTFQDTK